MCEPLVSILLPIYGHEPHIEDSLASLSGQSYSNLEVIAVTENLSEATATALSSSTLPITKLPYTDTGGLSGALNTGIENSSGDYIARMDADDVAMTYRLEKQVAVLEKNPNIGVLGSAYERIDKAGTSHGIRIPPLTNMGICWRLLLTSCIPHPTAMIRQSVLEETDIRYRPEFNAAEDYDLWVRLAEETTIRNLSEPLLNYRIAGGRKSERDSESQRRIGERIAVRTVNRWIDKIEFSDQQIEDIRRLLYGGASESLEKRSVVIDALSLYRAFEYETNGENFTESRNDLSVTAARGILRPPIALDSVPLLIHLLRISPRFPIRLISTLVKRRLKILN